MEICRRLCIGGFVISATFLSVAPTHAIDPDESLNHESVLEFAREIGISEESSRFRAISGDGRASLRPGEIKSEEVERESYPALPVVKHFKQQQGSALLKINPVKPQIKIDSEIEQRLTSFFVKQQEEMQSQIEQGLRMTDSDGIQDCIEDRVEKVKNPQAKTLKSKDLLRDYLYVSEDDFTPELTKKLAQETWIRPYSANRNSINFFSAHAFGVRCLPYRIRMTGKYIYRIEGRAALKSYRKEKKKEEGGREI